MTTLSNNGSTPGKNKSVKVVDFIFELIDGGEATPGQLIPTEAELASRLQVSRTVVREAIKSLVAVGVLKTQRGRGTFVRDRHHGPLKYWNKEAPSPRLSTFRDLLEFRLIVEPEVAALAAQRRNLDDIRDLERSVTRLEKSVMSGLNVKTTEDLEFHMYLAQASHNSALIDVSSMIVRFFQVDPDLPDEIDCQDHRAIFQEIVSRNVSTAREMMLKHLLRVKEKADPDAN